MAGSTTFAQTMLDAIEAALLARATGDQLDMVKTALGSRSIEFNPGELITLRDKFISEVARDDAAAKLAAGSGIAGRVRVRF